MQNIGKENPIQNILSEKPKKMIRIKRSVFLKTEGLFSSESRIKSAIRILMKTPV
jgi:hypothetical protein